MPASPPPGLVIGLSTGGGILALLLILLVVCVLRTRKKRREDPNQTELRDARPDVESGPETSGGAAGKVKSGWKESWRRWLRQKVSLEKKRFQQDGFDLDLTYVKRHRTSPSRWVGCSTWSSDEYPVAYPLGLPRVCCAQSRS
jgi:hypothetical protein